jgi:ribosomal protein L11 methyltransferase
LTFALGLETLDSSKLASLESGTPNSEFFSPQWWIRLTVPVPYEAAETVANFLVELGSLGVIESERDFSQPRTAFTEVQGFFPPEMSGPALCEVVTQHLHELRSLFPTLGQSMPHLAEVSNEAWAAQWRGHFPPLEVGHRFLVLPPWETSSSDSDRIPLVINPSMAFGTGHHATTQGCLEAIEALSSEHGPPPTALDVGTGSGILAIALAKLGIPTVWATDIDPIALGEAQKNCAANQVANAIHLSDTPVENLLTPVSLLVANLFSFTLVALATAIERLVSPGGYAILSGIQLDQEVDVHTAYLSPRWQLVHRYPREEWVTLVYKRS